ncbi:ABC transporter ATP-binding protein [Dactylosporangium sp. CA-092794]|uniref:ABC transporter ATP-binding protein n=1 Tax=Dactylosporangium sp. CA-092794 TaxID=3239929 RepID=UPI003D8D9D73
MSARGGSWHRGVAGRRASAERVAWEERSASDADPGPEKVPLLELHDVSVDYGSGRKTFRAVEGIGLSLGIGRTLALVGESGSGKTTIGKAILGVERVAGGEIRFDGEDITHASPSRRRELTAEIQVVYQDPFSSLNPARTIGQTVGEMLRPHGRPAANVVRSRVAEALERVGLPASTADRYPGGLSGGQRQRVAIARALIVEPRLIVCDEPVSALDTSVQAQVLNLLRELQRDLGVSYVFISHDLAVVRHVAHDILVLRRGRVVEYGDATRIATRPAEDYTRALLAAAPIADPVRQRERRAARALLA